MNWPIVIETAELPATENALRRTYRHPHAYRALRERWVKALLFGSGAAWRSRAIREAAKRGRMRVRIFILTPRLYEQDNADACRKFILDAARTEKVGYLTDDDQQWLASAQVVQIKTVRTRGTVIQFWPA